MSVAAMVGRRRRRQAAAMYIQLGAAGAPFGRGWTAAATACATAAMATAMATAATDEHAYEHAYEVRIRMHSCTITNMYYPPGVQGTRDWILAAGCTINRLETSVYLPRTWHTIILIAARPSAKMVVLAEAKFSPLGQKEPGWMHTTVHDSGGFASVASACEASDVRRVVPPLPPRQAARA